MESTKGTVMENGVKSQRTELNLAVFVDVGNLYYCVGKRWDGRRLDFDKFLASCRGDNRLLRAMAYGTEISNEADAFKRYLKTIGFDIKYKPHKFKEGDGEYRTDWNVGITLDIVRVIDRVDCIVLCTSNPEFVPLVEWIRERGVRCIIYACGVSRHLRKAADDFLEISEEMLIVQSE